MIIRIMKLAMRLAAKDDSVPLQIENRKELLKRFEEEYKKNKGVPYISDPKERKALLEKANEEAKTAEDLIHRLELIDFIESIPEDKLPPKPHRKRFIQWLAEAYKDEYEYSRDDVERVADFFNKKNFSIPELTDSMGGAKKAARLFSSRNKPPSGSTISFTIDPKKSTVDVIDGITFIKVDSQSADDPDDIKQFLINVGKFMDNCIGDMHGDHIAEDTGVAYIGLNNQNQPVCVLDNDGKGTEINEIKAFKNSVVEDPDVAVPLAKFILKRFSPKQFDKAEDFWVFSTVVEHNISPEDVPGIRPDSKKFLEDVLQRSEEEKSPDPISYMWKSVREKFANFDVDRVISTWSKDLDVYFTSFINKMPPKVAYEFVDRYIKEFNRWPGDLNAIVSKLGPKILNLPTNNSVLEMLMSKKVDQPRFEPICKMYLEKFKDRDILELLAESRQMTQPLRDRIIDLLKTMAAQGRKLNISGQFFYRLLNDPEIVKYLEPVSPEESLGRVYDQLIRHKDTTPNEQRELVFKAVGLKDSASVFFSFVDKMGPEIFQHAHPASIEQWIKDRYYDVKSKMPDVKTLPKATQGYLLGEHLGDTSTVPGLFDLAHTDDLSIWEEAILGINRRTYKVSDIMRLPEKVRAFLLPRIRVSPYDLQSYLKRMHVWDSDFVWPIIKSRSQEELFEYVTYVTYADPFAPLFVKCMTPETRRKALDKMGEWGDREGYKKILMNSV